MVVDKTDESFPLFQKLLFRKKEVLTASASFIAGVAILIGYFVSGPNAITYATAENAFSKWESSPLNDILYQSMIEAVRKVPDLQQKYEPVIAQTLINTEKIDEALTLAMQTLDRVKKETPFHSDFAQTSLLIERGGYQNALENAVALKERMDSALNVSAFLGDRLAGGAVLYVHNLVRIACLQQELKNNPGEKAAWEELEKFLGNGSILSEIILGSFSEKQLNLTQYIAERKKQL